MRLTIAALPGGRLRSRRRTGDSCRTGSRLSPSHDTTLIGRAHSLPTVGGMVETESRTVRLRALATLLIARCLLPLAALRAPGRARWLACQWALGIRFPAEDLGGLSRAARAAFTAARADAFWRHGQLIGLTSGHRDAAEQHRLFTAEVRRTGSSSAARHRVLPPEESAHVAGIAVDLRPIDGARWLERHGHRYHLYRRYDNEWWHFEYRPEYDGQAPLLRPHPGAVAQP
jgi:zinc D-Ala-D-Ala carboxypeptidase